MAKKQQRLEPDSDGFLRTGISKWSWLVIASGLGVMSAGYFSSRHDGAGGKLGRLWKWKELQSEHTNDYHVGYRKGFCVSRVVCSPIALADQWKMFLR